MSKGIIEEKAKEFYNFWMVDKSPKMFESLSKKLTADICCNEQNRYYDSKQSFMDTQTKKHLTNAMKIEDNVPPGFEAVSETTVRITTDTTQTRLGHGLDEVVGKTSQYHVKGYVDLTFDDDFQITYFNTKYTKKLLLPENKSFTPQLNEVHERKEVDSSLPVSKTIEKEKATVTP